MSLDGVGDEGVAGGAAERLAGVVIAGCPPAKSPVGDTSSTSSFGSLGSGGGAGNASAAGMSSTPKPVARSWPGGPTSRADIRITSKSCVLSRSGRAVQTSAAAPATIGAEKLVPDARM